MLALHFSDGKDGAIFLRGRDAFNQNRTKQKHPQMGVGARGILTFAS
jgi:hypothetical protein